MKANLADDSVITIYTLGHSTRPIGEFLSLLHKNHIKLLVDVRTIPKSRRNPQYWGDTLKESLKAARISYKHMAALGGLRKPTDETLNAGWRNRSFRGYADYMQTEKFLSALEELIAKAKSKKVVIVCAEAVPWRCHRNLIADALTVRGIRVEHIMSLTRNSPHKITAWAKVRGMKITYPEYETQSQRAAA